MNAELLAALHVARSRMAHFTVEESIQVDAAIAKAESDPTLRLLGIAGYELWKSHLVGNNCLSNQKRYDRMKEPMTGDLVLELSSTPRWIAGSRRTDWHEPENCLGYFVRRDWEPIPNWDEAEEGQPAPKEMVWYIRAFDGRELRWVNASFVTIVPVEGWTF